jgi:hypothetical protein
MILKTTMLYLPKVASLKQQYTLADFHIWNLHIILPYYTNWNIDELSILIDTLIMSFGILRIR